MAGRSAQRRGRAARGGGTMALIPVAAQPLVYGLLNIASATGIVFANKAGERGHDHGAHRRVPHPQWTRSPLPPPRRPPSLCRV